MKRKKQTKTKKKIVLADYIKAVKKADREIQLKQQSGFQRNTAIHKNKKAYDRKRDKRNFGEE